MRPRRRPDSRQDLAVQAHGRHRWRAGCRSAWHVLPVLVWLLGLGAAAPAKPRIRYITHAGVRYLYMVDLASVYGLRYESGSKRFALRSRSVSLQFAVDELEAVVNGTHVHLSDPPWVVKGFAVLADVDFRLLLSPIVRGTGLHRGDVRRVLIDPGHGGPDPGTLSGKKREKDISLQVARRLEKELVAKGFAVTLTRTRDAEVALGGRAQKVRAVRADILVSLHCNAAGAGIRGVESFRLPPVGARSTYSSQRASTTCTNNAWDADNARLAYEIQRATVSATGATDRGVKSARFMVLRESACPAVLVEMGFLSHPTEAANLANADYQAKLARGIAQGISRYDACLPRK